MCVCVCVSMREREKEWMCCLPLTGNWNRYCRYKTNKVAALARSSCYHRTNIGISDDYSWVFFYVSPSSSFWHTGSNYQSIWRGETKKKYYWFNWDGEWGGRGGSGDLLVWFRWAEIAAVDFFIEWFMYLLCCCSCCCWCWWCHYYYCCCCCCCCFVGLDQRPGRIKCQQQQITRKLPFKFIRPMIPPALMNI